MIGHDRIIYTMTMDGLEDAYSPGKPMGAFAQDAANDYQFTREMQDAYAACSLDRARATISSGAIAGEIVAVEIKSRTGSVIADTDEQPGQATPEKFPDLRPVFAAEGSITAASSASMSVDAAALVLTRLSKATALDVKPIARVVGSAAHAQAPALSTTAPVKAIEKLLAVDRRGGSSRGEKGLRCGRDDCSQGSHHPDEKINVNGGTTALGHPIGVSGARIIATLLAALEHRGGRRGIASLCIGGGEATAMAFELFKKDQCDEN